MGKLARLQAPRFRWLGFAISLVVALSFSYFKTGESLDRKILDRQFNLLQQRAHPIQNDVVIVGIDGESWSERRTVSRMSAKWIWQV